MKNAIYPGNIILIMLLLGFVQKLKAQTWAEWFNQKQTQRKYLLEQIAALKVYTGYLKKGYNIAKDGTQLIGDIKNGDFSLHKNYLGSLSSVNPSIKAYDKVDAIIAGHSVMVQMRQKIIAEATKSRMLSNSELKSLAEKLSGLITESGKDIDELTLVLSDGQTQMTDDERISHIDRLYSAMKSKYSAQKKFGNNIKVLIAARRQEQTDARNLKVLFGNGN